MSRSDHNRYVLIMAGGAGTRLWPLSRSGRPKQFQAFTDKRTLLQHMVDLSLNTVPIERVMIMATPEFSEIIREQVPELPPANLLFEPARRDNGPAVALGAMQIAARDPEAVMAVLWSDHLIQNVPGFSEMLNGAFAAAGANPASMVTVGTKPTSPDPTLGYIQMGKQVDECGGQPVFEVRRFVEKPDAKTAERLVARWEYLWNVGYKVVTAQGLLQGLRAARPDLASALDALEAAVQADTASVARAYEAFDKESIEYLYTQHVDNLLVVPADLGWSDLGSWNVLHDVLKSGSAEDMVCRGPVTQVSSRDCLVIAKDRPIAVVGAEGLVIVDDGDCLLVLQKERAGDIKALGSALEATYPELR